MAEEGYRFSPGGSVDQRRNLYEALLEAGRFSPETVERDRMLQEEFGPPDVFQESLQVTATAPESIDEAMSIYMDNVQNDISGIMPLDAPSEGEYQQAETEIESDLTRLDKMSPFRQAMELGEGNPLGAAQRQRNKNVSETLFGKRSALVRGEPEEGVKVVKEPEKLTKKAAPALDATADEIMGPGDEFEPSAMARTTSLTSQIETESEGEKEGRRIIMESPYAYGLEVYDDVIEKIKADRVATEGEYEFFKTQKKTYIDLANDIKSEITAYEDKINAIAQEKPEAAYSGPNAFWAVIAAALGAGASAITGTPNFALQIMNKTIDDNLEKFKNDRDFRKQSIERQQLNLITERGRMLQMAQNASDSALASLKNRSGMEAQIATVEGIKQEIMGNREKNDQQLVLALQQLQYKKFAAEQAAKQEYGDKYIPGLGVTSIKDKKRFDKSMIDGTALMTGIYTVDDLREKALKIFDEVGKAGLIAQSAAGFGKAQGKDYIALRQLVGSMFGIYKNDIMKGGAALTPTEVVMITKVLPQESVSGVLLGEMETALRSLPKEYESRVKGFQKAHQFTPVTPLDYFYQQPGKPGAQMPNSNQLPSPDKFKGTTRKTSG